MLRFVYSSGRVAWLRPVAFETEGTTVLSVEATGNVTGDVGRELTRDKLDGSALLPPSDDEDDMDVDPDADVCPMDDPVCCSCCLLALLLSAEVRPSPVGDRDAANGITGCCRLLSEMGAAARMGGRPVG